MIRTVHVFQCGSADLYGVTRDQTGANLPTDECSEGWRFIRPMEMEEGLPPRGMGCRLAGTRCRGAGRHCGSWLFHRRSGRPAGRVRHPRAHTRTARNSRPISEVTVRRCRSAFECSETRAAHQHPKPFFLACLGHCRACVGDTRYVRVL
jgi:hypothetical protein